MLLINILKEICNPTVVWLVIIFIIYIIYFFDCINGQGTVNNIAETFLLIGIYILVWTIFIDLACKYNREISAWFLIALGGVLAFTKINWIKMIHSSINDNLMGDDEIYDEDNLWDYENWNSFFIPGKRVPGFPELNTLFSNYLLTEPLLLDNPLPQLPLPGPPSYGPDRRFMI